MLSERWRASVPVVAAVAVVAALSLLTVTVMSSIGEDDERAQVDVEGSSTTTEATSRRIAPRPSTTTTAPPEVLGETTEREPDAPGAADDAGPVPVGAPGPGPLPAAPPVTAAPSPAPAPPPGPAPAPPPTTTCRNSTDPACGPFTWDPQPGEYQVEVYAVSTPITAAVGEPVRFAVDYVDPAGPGALGACVNWSAPDAVVDISTCQEIATECTRTGPHDPPAPSTERIRAERTLTFEQPGTYEVSVGGNVATHLADGCPSPYRNLMDRRVFTIEVR